jgi:hypothetical protein
LKELSERADHSRIPACCTLLADEKDSPHPLPNKTADSQPSFRNNLPFISACFFLLQNPTEYDVQFAMP